MALENERAYKMLRIMKYVNAIDLKAELLGDAIETLEVIIKNNKFQELAYLLEELYREPVDIAVINDLLWFDAEYIYAILGIESAFYCR